MTEMFSKWVKIKSYNLFLNNKDTAFETFFSTNIEYLVISCQKKAYDNQKFKCYFLFLSISYNKGYTW